MAFCRNCGQEMPKGSKFCANCGSKDGMDNKTEQRAMNTQSTFGNNAGGYQAKDSLNDETVMNAWIDKFGKLYGILLLILAFVDIRTDPAIVTIALSAAIIFAAIFCLIKKYKLKGFTIVALIIAVICLLCGYHQYKEMGLFKMPEDYRAEKAAKTAEERRDFNPVIDRQTAQTPNSKEDAIEMSKTSEEETESEEVTSEESSVEETSTEEKKDKPTGLNPELKEFMDSYEAFMDEYVDFMQKYNADPNNSISMMAEYLEILGKYSDFAEKADKYHEDEMSDEDLAYYLEVMARIEKKMLMAM